jgi:hypothetical protein
MKGINMDKLNEIEEAVNLSSKPVLVFTFRADVIYK